MAIYGTGLLAACLIVGLLLGRSLGWLFGLEANIGGVGIAMVLLIFGTEFLRKRGRLASPSEAGILFWSSLYIPVVVAMAASQNVVAAVNGGVVALLAGVGSVVACFALVPWVSRIGGGGTNDQEGEFPP